MQFGFLLEQVVNGLVLGGYYLLISLGLSLIFSVGGIVNLAHGAFYALGAYGCVEITKYLGFGPAVVLSPIAVALLGILFERFILRRFYTADPILSLLVTFGLSRRLPVFALPSAHSGRGCSGPAWGLALAAQDLVRLRGARRHSKARHGRSARHQVAALHDLDRHARRRHGGARRRVLRADHDRASRHGRRDHHGRLCRGGDRRARQFLGCRDRGAIGRRGARHHHSFRPCR